MSGAGGGSNSARFLDHFCDLECAGTAPAKREKERGNLDGTRFSFISQTASQVARFYEWTGGEAADGPYATKTRSPIPKNVPVLRADHTALQTILSGMREVFESGLSRDLAMRWRYAYISRARSADGSMMYRFLLGQKRHGASSTSPAVPSTTVN